MLKHSTRRWLAGLGVAGALVAASASPAAAEEPDIELGVFMADTTIAADSDGKIQDLIIGSSEPVVLHELTARYDFRNLAGKVTLTSEGLSTDCSSPETGVLVCTDPFEVGVDEWGIGGMFPVTIAPTDEAKDGDAGTVTVTLSAAGIDPVSHEAKVRVGEGVDLAAGPATKLSVAPGATFTAPATISNAGETTAKGASVVFYNDYGIQAQKRYSNCTYSGNELRTCHFDESLEPGASYTALLSYMLGKDTFAPGSEYGEIIWMTPAEYEDFAAYLDTLGVSPGEPGTDGPLTLAAAKTSATRSTQADTRPDNNSSSLEVTVTGENGTDLEAIGDSVKGGKGHEVTATVGFRNNGPATLDYTRGDSSVTYMNVEIPEGTTAVEVPEVCLPVEGDDEQGEPGEPGARTYFCYADPFIAAGDEATVEFTLRIDKVIPNAAGAVKINVPCPCDGGFYDDLKPANDTAKLLVNATGKGPDGGEGGGDGGELPITGANTGLIAGVGALLLAAGASGFVVARRRKTRFVA